MLGGVVKLGKCRKLYRRLATEGTKTTGHVGHVNPSQATDHPTAEALQIAFEKREVGNSAGLPVADNQIGLAGENWFDEFVYIAAIVLVVAVGVDDDIRAQPQAGVKTGLESMPQTPVLWKADNVIGPALARHLAGAVGRSVVYN